MINDISFPHTRAKLNYNLDGKEFILQHNKRGYRCISWHPHYIMTEWVKTKSLAIGDGDMRIEEYNKSMIL